MPEAVKIEQALIHGRIQLAAAGVQSPAPDAAELLGCVLNCAAAQVRLHAVMQRSITSEQQQKYSELIAARARRIPLQHITGKAYFYQNEILVGPGVFVPRPETECLVNHVFSELSAKHSPKIIDLCTGSGAIAFALAEAIPHAQVVAVEKDPLAYKWAQKNQAALKLERVQLLHAAVEMLEDDNFSVLGANKFDAVVSNPPYVPQSEVPAAPEVAEYDPPGALYSGADGLELIRKIVPLAALITVPQGILAIEHTETQGAAVCEIMRSAGFESAATHNDLTGRPRFSLALRGKA